MAQGQIIPKGEKKWLVRWYVGRDASGKRRYASEVVHGTRRTAEAKLRAKLKLKDEGRTPESGKIPLGKHLDDWLGSIEGTCSARTLESYRDVLRLYVRPAIGAVRLDTLSLGHIEDDLIKKMQADGKSTRTIRYAVTILSSACKWGVRRRRIAFNPCDEVRLPKAVRTEMLALTPEQVQAFRKAAVDDRHAVLFDFLIFTGARPGEAFALRWQDVDFEEGVARIQQTLSTTKKTWEFREPKAGSRRVVPLPAVLLTALRKHRSEQAREALKLGEGYARELDLVFANEVGEPLNRRNLTQRHFRPAAKAAGLPPRTRLYDLRHTHASNLLAAGEPVKAVSERLGHASAKMTLDVYAHVLPGQGERLAGVAERLFSGAS